MNQVKCKNIIKFYEVKRQLHKICIVLEYCQFGDLEKILHKKGKEQVSVDEITAKNLIGQIVNGLVYLNKNGIAHRDLKLSNIMITEDFRVVLGDFGLAKQIN